MTDHVIIASPFGPMAFSALEIRNAVARANEVLQAVSLTPDRAPAPSTPGEPTQWLSIDEVACRSGLRKSWLYEQIRADNIPHRHFGRQVRIPASYLAAPDSESGSKQPGDQ